MSEHISNRSARNFTDITCDGEPVCERNLYRIYLMYQSSVDDARIRFERIFSCVDEHAEALRERLDEVIELNLNDSRCDGIDCACDPYNDERYDLGLPLRKKVRFADSSSESGSESSSEFDAAAEWDDGTDDRAIDAARECRLADKAVQCDEDWDK